MKEFNLFLEMLADFISRDEIYASLFLLIVAICCLVLPWILLGIAYRLNKTRYFVLSFPTMKARDAYSGLTYLEGIAETQDPLSSYLTDTQCVWYAYYVQEQWKKTLKTKYVDRKGREHVKRETVYGWSPLYADEVYQPFFLHDETGSIQVNPSGARAEPVTLLSRECSVDDPLYFDKGPEGCIPYSTYRRRFVEEAVPLHHQITVLGTAREREDSVDPEIGDAGDETPFIISTRNRKKYLSSLEMKTWLCQLAGFAVVSLPLGFFLVASGINLQDPLKPLAYPCSLSLVVLYVVCGILLWRRHELKSLKKIRERAWQAKKKLEHLHEERSELIPDLFKIATYYCDRNSHPELFTPEYCRQLETGETTFDELIRNYPELAKGKIFLPLNRKLRHTEERIVLATRSYDAYAANFNSMIRKFPGSIVHLIYKLKPMPRSSELDMSKFLPNVHPPCSDSTGR